MSGATELRSGFSTGACIAAVVKAAALSDYSSSEIHRIEVLFPDGKHRSLLLFKCRNGFAEIVKDGGDDPDCTNGAHLYARMHSFQGMVDERDLLIVIGSTRVYIRAVEGIGFVTRKGLPCKEGKWAINPVPLKMIEENLAETDMGSTGGSFLFEIGVRGGSLLAKKTLNERLGITGGISILGTTGVVRPYSHDAYEKAIRMQVACAKANGAKCVLFATGSRTASGAEGVFDALNPEAVILIADFIASALYAAEEHGMEGAFIACMPGKLLKYIAGYENTHAHKKEQRLGPLEEIIKSTFPEKTCDLTAVPTVREAVEGFSREELYSIFTPLVRMAQKSLQRFVSSVTLDILLFDFQGVLLVRSDEPQECTEEEWRN